MSHYGRHSLQYRNRARKRLDEGTKEALFYAALEIRLGIEVRLKEYLAVQDHISKAKKKGWKVANLGKSIESTFRTGDKIARFTVLHGKTQEILSVLLYTPVSRKLQGMGQHMGKYLHALRPENTLSEEWWSQFRTFLEGAWQELKRATSGQLLGVPLLHRQTGKTRMIVQFEREEDTEAFRQRVGAAGSQVILKVEYLDDA